MHSQAIIPHLYQSCLPQDNHGGREPQLRERWKPWSINWSVICCRKIMVNKLLLLFALFTFTLPFSLSSLRANIVFKEPTADQHGWKISVREFCFQEFSRCLWPTDIIFLIIILSGKGNGNCWNTVFLLSCFKVHIVYSTCMYIAGFMCVNKIQEISMNSLRQTLNFYFKLKLLWALTQCIYFTPPSATVNEKSLLFPHP